MPTEKNASFKYCLTVIDLSTRYALVVLLKNKTEQEVTTAFQKISKQSGRRANKLWCNRSTDFFNKKSYTTI